MINLRNLRIAIYYLTMLLLLIFIRNYYKVNFVLNKYTYMYYGAHFITKMHFLTIMFIPFIAFWGLVTLVRIINIFGYKGDYYKEEHLIEWKYSSDEWKKLIIKNFKIDIKNELKNSIKYLFSLNSDFLLLIFLEIIMNKIYTCDLDIIGIPVVVYIIYSFRGVIKKFIGVIDHIIFTNRTIIIMRSYAIINNDVHSFDIPRGRELEDKRIEGYEIKITYAIASRFAGRFDNKERLDLKEVNNIIIPIPYNCMEEAKNYINEPYPIYLENKN